MSGLSSKFTSFASETLVRRGCRFGEGRQTVLVVQMARRNRLRACQRAARVIGVGMGGNCALAGFRPAPLFTEDFKNVTNTLNRQQQMRQARMKKFHEKRQSLTNPESVLTGRRELPDTCGIDC